MTDILQINKKEDMRAMNKIFLYGIIITMVFSLISCEEEECDQSLRNDAGVGFYTFEENVETDTALPSISVYARNRPDSLLYDSIPGQTGVRLPLDPTKDFSEFIFAIDSLHDTLQIKYNRELNLISQPCGFITDFHIQEIKTPHHHFDSIVVINNRITQNENEEHFKIYFSPSDTADL
ncbi:MAG: hypothetical protein K9H65_03755 [Bacteroidales bacterium]|nr:hypothetical protein [Bacteroidales bacterium]